MPQLSRAPLIGTDAHMVPAGGRAKPSSNLLLSAVGASADMPPGGNQLMAAAPQLPVQPVAPIIAPSASLQPNGAAMSTQAAQGLRRPAVTPNQAGRGQADSGYLTHALAELARRASPVSTAEVAAVINKAVAAGHLSPNEAGIFIASIPVDKVKLMALAQAHVLRR